MLGRIISFYSYKGGTGRSMALANVAWILAANNHRVLVIDWDLEAPGLHRYFLPFLDDPELTETPGLIDLLWSYTDLLLDPRNAKLMDIDDPMVLADAQRSAVPLEFPFEPPEEFSNKDGCLHFLGAGKQEDAYASRVGDFDWNAFYERLGGGMFLDAFRERLKRQYDYVLIDSRTGIADTSGICTMHLPDTVVLCFTYNRQNIKGIEAVARSILEYRRDIELLPVPMRVERSIQGLDEAREFAQRTLNPFLPSDMEAEAREDYWARYEVAYYPEYAFAESLAVLRERPRQRNTLLSDIQWLSGKIVGDDSDLQMLSIKRSLRERYLRRFAFSDPRQAELARLRASDPSAAYPRMQQLLEEAQNESDSDVVWLQELANTIVSTLPRLPEPGTLRSSLSAIEETIDLYRPLAKVHLETFAPDLAASLNNLAIRLKELGRLQEALDTAQEATDLYSSLAEVRPDVFRLNLAASRNYLATIYYIQGRYDEAESRYQEALAIYKEAFGSDHQQVAGSHHDLAKLYAAQGRYDEAELRYQDALAIYKQTLGAERPEVAVTLNDLAELYATQGRYDEAELHYREALAIYEQTLEAERPEVAVTLNNLAELCAAQGRYDEAGPLYERALVIRQRTLGADHLDAAETLNDLAKLYTAQNQYGQAESLFQLALTIRQRTLGPDHPDSAETQNDLADLFTAQGDYGQAESLYQNALGIRERTLGEEHPVVAVTQQSYARLLRKAHRDEEAAKLEAEAKAIQAKHPRKHPVN